MRRPAEVLRAAYPQALATLVRLVGDLDAAQDALQDAAERALARWETEIPKRPAAWLVKVGRNVAIDRARRRTTARRYTERAISPEPQELLDNDLVEEFRDDMLRLMFTCCHPALSGDSQVALTLHTVVGLSVSEIARAYLVPPVTMERRISRARRALRDAELPYEVPAPAELPTRLEAVCAVVLVLFNEGYTESAETQSLRPRLCELAIRLARLVARSFRDEAEVSGLLAWLLLQHSRWRSRTAEPGRIVTLEHQDRALWDRGLIAEGRAIVERALRRGELGPYQVQAAIAAVHAMAPDFKATDWAQIVALYDVLLQYQPTPVVRLNRAVALSRSEGPLSGLAALDELQEHKRLRDYHLFHAARAHLLEESGRVSAAADAYRRALELAPSEPERTYLAEKIEKVERTN